jgi:hypothetical protein
MTDCGNFDLSGAVLNGPDTRQISAGKGGVETPLASGDDGD